MVLEICCYEHDQGPSFLIFPPFPFLLRPWVHVAQNLPHNTSNAQIRGSFAIFTRHHLA